MAAETFSCIECGSEFDIIHNEKGSIEFCPFCGEELMTEEELDEWREEMWDGDEDEDI